MNKDLHVVEQAGSFHQGAIDSRQDGHGRALCVDGASAEEATVGEPRRNETRHGVDVEVPYQRSFGGLGTARAQHQVRLARREPRPHGGRQLPDIERDGIAEEASLAGWRVMHDLEAAFYRPSRENRLNLRDL